LLGLLLQRRFFFKQLKKNAPVIGNEGGTAQLTLKEMLVGIPQAGSVEELQGLAVRIGFRELAQVIFGMVRHLTGVLEQVYDGLFAKHYQSPMA
jgi:hypothetical protein